jgi:hypothetical protein
LGGKKESSFLKERSKELLYSTPGQWCSSNNGSITVGTVLRGRADGTVTRASTGEIRPI